MPLPTPLSDVPQNKVGEVVQDFLDFDDVKEVQAQQQPDGKFTVTPIN